MGSLILVGAGTKNQIWLDALTSIVPFFVITYVILQHFSGSAILSPFQVCAARITTCTMRLEVVIDLGLTMLLGRQVLDVGGGVVG